MIFYRNPLIFKSICQLKAGAVVELLFFRSNTGRTIGISFEDALIRC